MRKKLYVKPYVVLCAMTSYTILADSVEGTTEGMEEGDFSWDDNSSDTGDTNT